MRKLLLLAMFALAASLIFATAVAAQEEDTPPEEQLESQEAQGEEDPGVLAPGPVGETEQLFGEPEVIETPLEESAEEPVEEAFGLDKAEAPAEEKAEEKAQEQVPVKADVKVEDTKVTVEETIPGGYAPLPKSGGMQAGALLLPAAALLLGSGLLVYAVLRRR